MADQIFVRSIICAVLPMAIIFNVSNAAAEKLWATNYYVQPATVNPNGEPLLTRAGIELAKIAPKTWCLGAIEGTIIVKTSTGVHTYNVDGTKGLQLDCLPYLAPATRLEPWAKFLGKSRWQETQAKFGLGTGGYKLVPFRTIAVDRTKFQIGTVLYIAAAKGVKYELPNGDIEIHDGYFFAGDVGSGIKGNHIDVFTGLTPNKVFSFIKSTSSATFEASVVTDEAIRNRLRAMHK